MNFETLIDYMQFFDKEDLRTLITFLTDVKGIRMPAIAEATGISLSTIKNIKTGKSGKKDYFDKIIKAYPEGLESLKEKISTSPTQDTRQEIFREAQETAEKLAEIKMERRLRNLIPRLEAAENITEEEMEALLLAYEVLRMPVPERFQKK